MNSYVLVGFRPSTSPSTLLGGWGGGAYGERERRVVWGMGGGKEGEMGAVGESVEVVERIEKEERERERERERENVWGLGV